MKSHGRWAMMAVLGLLAAGCGEVESTGGESLTGDSGSSGGAASSGNTTELEQVLIDTGNYQHSLAMLHADGEAVFFESPAPDVMPTSLTYQGYPGDSEVQLVMEPSGLPDYLYVDGWFVLFGNWNSSQTRVDVALISPDGAIDVVHDLDCALPPPPGYQAMSVFEIVRWSGHTLGAIHCVTSLAATISTAGLAFPFAVLGCTRTVLAIMAEFDEDDGEVTPAELANLSGGLGLLQCGMSVGFEGNWEPCLELFAQQANNFAEWVVEEVEEHAEEIANGNGALNSGHGDFQATLTWDTTADLDLWVTDPFGETIIYYNPDSASGGHLDVDDTNGYGPENIFWPPGVAPEGDYLVQVDHFSGASPTGYAVLVQVGDQSYPFSGTILTNQLVTIGTFTLSDYPSMEAGTLPPILMPADDPQLVK